MAFNSKQASTGGTGIRTSVVSNEHIQHITVVNQNGTTEPNSSNFYNASFNIAPTTLTTGLNYFIIRNSDATKQLKIKRIVADAFFVGTAVASKSVFVLKKLTNVTATTGTTILVVKRDTIGNNTVAEVKQLPTGITATGGVDAGNISHIGIPNQLTANMNKDWQFDTPIVLKQNEAIVVQSEGAIVLGANVVFSIQFYEV